MIAAALSGEVVTGLVLGFLFGLLAGPLIRSWLTWREWASASGEADLIREVLERMDVDSWPPLEEPEADDTPHPAGRTDAS